MELMQNWAVNMRIKVKAKDDSTLKLPERTITGVRDECQDGKRCANVHNAFIKKINGERDGIISLKHRFGSG